MTAEILDLFVRTIGVGLSCFIVVIVSRAVNEAKVNTAVDRAVKAAEILFDVPKSGKEKKAWVIQKIHKLFGFSWLKDEYIELLLEAAVSELKLVQNKEE